VGPRPPMWAAETEWQVLIRSRCLLDRVQVWSAEDDRLAFDAGGQFMTAAHRRNVSIWAGRDQVLTALLKRADEDAVARRMALQVVTSDELLHGRELADRRRLSRLGTAAGLPGSALLSHDRSVGGHTVTVDSADIGIVSRCQGPAT
jgi:hypothetical protein